MRRERATLLGVHPETPGPGQESVWDYPRPPKLERVHDRLRVLLQGVTIAETTRGWRVLETSHPPVYYFPPEDVRHIAASLRAPSHCEFKGRATFHQIELGGEVLDPAAWSYADPWGAFEAIRGAIAFYAHGVDAWIDDQRVTPQPGGFYGGWITPRVVGPFKGAPGSRGW